MPSVLMMKIKLVYGKTIKLPLNERKCGIAQQKKTEQPHLEDFDSILEAEIKKLEEKYE